MTEMKLHRVEAGMYQTADKRYAIVKMDSYNEWDGVSDTCWIIVDGDPRDGAEMPGEYPTKRDAVAALVQMLAKESTPRIDTYQLAGGMWVEDEVNA